MTTYRPTMKNDETMSLACLHARRLQAIDAPDEPQWAWFFRFEGGTTLTVEAVWRVVGRARVEIARDDHHQMFGLTEPVDAGRVALDAISGTLVEAAEFEEKTGDLRITFENGARLEVLTCSSSHESWQLQRPDGTVLVGTGGGEVVPTAPD